jgi:hypothetical protein
MASAPVVLFALVNPIALTPGRLQMRPSNWVSQPRVLMQAIPPPDGSDSDPSQGSKPSDDWDSAWQREIAKRKQGQAEWRPEGREPVSRQQLVEARGKKVTDDAVVAVQRWSKCVPRH